MVFQGEATLSIEELERARLREIHHQVKNSLQVVCSLLRIQARGLHDPASRAIFKRGEERIQSMALVYDTLYRGAPFEEVPLHNYLAEMTRQLVNGRASTSQAVELSSEFDPLFVSSKVATHCGLMINEIVSHRMRQTAIDGEILSIFLRLTHQEQGIDVEIYDNGPLQDQSVGVWLVEQQILEALIRQLEGEVTFPASDQFLMRVSIPNRALGMA
jgi:two-component sensor histidine kinase